MIVGPSSDADPYIDRQMHGGSVEKHSLLPRCLIHSRISTMSNRAYLTASNVDTIYASFAQKGYDPAEQLMATDVENLPLLWLALFREGDLQHKTFKVQ